MMNRSQRTLLCLVLLGSTLPLAAPALAFELFGIRLWGSDESEDAVEVIDPVRYTIVFEVDTDHEDLESALRDASALWTDRDEPAPGRAGLIAKARGDYRRLLAALYNAGHYGPEISIRLAGREASEVTLGDPLPAEIPVAVAIRPGPRFRFGIAEILNPPPWTEEQHPGTVGFQVGAPAQATRIGAASRLAVERWRRISHAKARETGREVVADHETRRLEASILIDPGRAAVYGPVQVVGHSRVDSDFIAYMADLRSAGTSIPTSLPRRRRDSPGSGPSIWCRSKRPTRSPRTALCRSASASRIASPAPSGSARASVRSKGSPSRASGCTATSSAVPSSFVSTRPSRVWARTATWRTSPTRWA
jgi:translocation and assembly module TamA